MTYEYNGAEYSATDMQRKFSQSWLNLEGFGIVRIDTFADNEFYYSINDEARMAERTKFVVLAEFPVVDTMVNYKKSCGLISRIPRRQWTAGVTRNTVSAVNPAGYYFYDGRTLTQSLVEAMFNPTYVEIHKIYDAIKKDSSVCLAFDGRYWLCSTNGRDVELWRKSFKIGKLEKLSNVEYNLTLDDFCLSMEQELNDEVKHVRFNLIKSV